MRHISEEHSSKSHLFRNELDMADHNIDGLIMSEMSNKMKAARIRSVSIHKLHGLMDRSCLYFFTSLGIVPPGLTPDPGSLNRIHG